MIMKKLLLALLPAFAMAASNTSVVDPFTQMDKIFEMQMKQMQAMQKEMDSMFKEFEKGSLGSSTMPVIYSSGGMMSSGLQDKGDHYELDIKIAKAAKTDFDIKSDDGLLTVKVSQTNEINKKDKNQLFKSHSSSSYMQSFTLPKDADADNIKHEMKDDKIIVTIPKKK
jgi:HSP20 family molecular chaperone IbpA